MGISNSVIKYGLNEIIKIGNKKIKKQTTPKISEQTFDYVKNTSGKYFTAGFGKAVMLPENLKQKKYYIAGYSSNNPAKGVIDPQYAHALWLDDNSGHGGILFISLDVVGLLHSDTQHIREMLSDFSKLTGCRAINVLSTHNHAGIDTMGIWGKLPFSGKSREFMNILFDAVKAAAVSAYEDRRQGNLYYGTIKVPDMQEDTRTPVVYSDVLTRFRFVPNDSSREIHFINFASHSESLQGCNNLVSADFPCYLREKIRLETGAETIYGVGAIGGMISMEIHDEKTLRKEHRLLESTRNIGYKLADYSLKIDNEVRLEPKISCLRKEFYCPAENPVLTIACQIGILATARYTYPGKEGINALKTELNYIEIGCINLLLLPCELFPELAYGGYLDSENSAEGKSPEINPEPLIKTANDENLLIFGLANDELGYVIPPNDFLLNSDMPYMEKAIDRLNRRHYEETNSLGPETALYISDTFKSMMREINAIKENNQE